MQPGLRTSCRRMVQLSIQTQVDIMPSISMSLAKSPHFIQVAPRLKERLSLPWATGSATFQNVRGDVRWALPVGNEDGNRGHLALQSSVCIPELIGVCQQGIMSTTGTHYTGDNEVTSCIDLPKARQLLMVRAKT